MKRFNFILLLWALLYAFDSFAQSMNEQVLLGDLDNDGLITKSDISVMSSILLGSRSSRYIPVKYVNLADVESGMIPASSIGKRHLLADIDLDGKVSVTDMKLLIDMMSGTTSKVFIERDLLIDTLGVRNGHEYVDLGLSVKWATCNIGANSPLEQGRYFAWGEVSAKEHYLWSNYEWMHNGQSSWHYINKYTFNDYMTYASWYDANKKFIGDGKYTINVSDDAVAENWGAEWRMPTFDELSELKSLCTWKWTSNYNSSGMSGYVITSKVAGYTNKSIFLPASGYMDDSTLRIFRTNGVYWTNELSSSSSCNAFALGFNSQNIYWFEMERFYGFSIRPVLP